MSLFSISDYFGFEKKPLLGIDISSRAVKLLLISRAKGIYTVEAFGIECLPPGVVVENTIKNIDVLAEAIKRLVERLPLETNWVATSVSGANVITRTIQMNQNLTEQEILDEIEIDAARYISFPFEEINLDIQILGPARDDPEKQDVLLAISRTENVASREAALSLAGLETKIVEIDAFSLERAFPCLANQLPNYGLGKSVAVLDLGATTMTLNIFFDHKRLYTRAHGFGGQNLTEEIQRRYGLSFEEAEQEKKADNLPSDYTLEVFESFQNMLIQQIGHSFQFYFSAHDTSEIDYIILTGGTSLLHGLDILIQERLLYKTIKAQLFQEMHFKNDTLKHAIMPHQASLMVCLGLALRNCVDG